MGEMSICSACERHVYLDEPACPFCGSAEARLPAGPRLSGRLSRAAAHAARAAILVGAVSCSEAHDSDADAAAQGDGGAVEDGAVADAGPGDDAGPSFDGAAQQDASKPGDAGGAEASVADASADASGEEADADVPIYGGVFPDPRKRAVV